MRKQFATNLSLLSIDRIRKLSEVTGIPQSKLLDAAVELLATRYEPLMSGEARTKPAPVATLEALEYMARGEV